MMGLSAMAQSLFLLPTLVQIETTTKCNLRCRMCLRTQTNPDLNYDMSPNVFKLIIDQLVCLPFKKPTLRLVGLGEPLLNPHIISMVRYAKRKGFLVDLVSNFTLANPKTMEKLVETQLDYLGVSLDAASPKVFENKSANGFCKAHCVFPINN
jgi:MoaA/NifB/PqqE/SkfB family radical SAM enzyme